MHGSCHEFRVGQGTAVPINVFLCLNPRLLFPYAEAILHLNLQINNLHEGNILFHQRGLKSHIGVKEQKIKEMSYSGIKANASPLPLRQPVDSE